MGFLEFLKRWPKVEGEIGYFNLTEWWLSTFTEVERNHIESVYRPLGCSLDDETPRPLTQGQISWSSGSASKLLYGLASWFYNPVDRYIAHRILAKAEELAESSGDVLDLHFTYHAMIQIYYKDRDAGPVALNDAIVACEKQIALSPKTIEAFKKEFPDHPLPNHLGFTQLAIIREKQGDYIEAIRLSKLAMEQGWSGDWEDRITRYEKKLNRGKVLNKKKGEMKKGKEPN